MEKIESTNLTILTCEAEKIINYYLAKLREVIIDSGLGHEEVSFNPYKESILNLFTEENVESDERSVNAHFARKLISIIEEMKKTIEEKLHLIPSSVFSDFYNELAHLSIDNLSPEELIAYEAETEADRQADHLFSSGPDINFEPHEVWEIIQAELTEIHMALLDAKGRIPKGKLDLIMRNQENIEAALQSAIEAYNKAPETEK